MANCQWKHKVYTSTAYRYSRPDWSAEKNQQVFGRDASTSGVGYNLVIEAKLDSQLMAEEEFRKKLYDTSRLIDHKFLNEDVPELSVGAVSLERICIFLKERLGIPESQVRVTENHRCAVETLAGGELALCLFERVNAVHRHWNPELSEKENRELYGKCSGLHGHEYNIEISVKGPVDSDSQMLASRDSLKEMFRQNVVEPLDGSFLNDQLGNTSGEKIALQVLDRVKNCPMTQQTYRIVVRETRKNSFAVGATFF